MVTLAKQKPKGPAMKIRKPVPVKKPIAPADSTDAITKKGRKPRPAGSKDLRPSKSEVVEWKNIETPEGVTIAIERVKSSKVEDFTAVLKLGTALLSWQSEIAGNKLLDKANAKRLIVSRYMELSGKEIFAEVRGMDPRDLDDTTAYKTGTAFVGEITGMAAFASLAKRIAGIDIISLYPQINYKHVKRMNSHLTKMKARENALRTAKDQKPLSLVVDAENRKILKGFIEDIVKVARANSATEYGRIVSNEGKTKHEIKEAELARQRKQKEKDKQSMRVDITLLVKMLRDNRTHRFYTLEQVNLLIDAATEARNDLENLPEPVDDEEDVEELEETNDDDRD